MFFIRKIGYVTVTLFHFLSCSSVEIPKDVASILSKTKNGIELKKVIDHYRNDSLKLEATYYLIRNMDGLQSLDTLTIADNNKYFDALQTRWSIEEKKPRDIEIICSTIDSVNKVFDLDPLPITPEYLKDLDIISSGFLINNIEFAFKAWRTHAWSKSVNFETFCEYILPYRCTPTYSDQTRGFFFNRFDDNKILKQSRNSIDAGKIITKDIDKWFLNNTLIFAKHPFLHPIKFSNLLKGKIGECYDQNALKTGALRSLGIPTAFDEIPNWGSQNNRHYWYKILDPINDTIKTFITNRNVAVNTQHIISGTSFNLTKVYSGVPQMVELHYTRTIPKVYRQSFKKEPNSIAMQEISKDSIPEYFRNTRLRDVTNKYVDCSDVKLKLTNRSKAYRYVYLCVFNNRGWLPVAWSRLNKDTANFACMGKNIVYLPAYYVDGAIVPAGDPFLLNLEGKVKTIKPGIKKEILNIYTKYPYRMVIHEWQSKIIGGKFQFANDSSFSDSTTIHAVKELPFYRQNILINSKKKYRYLTFQYPDIHLFIAEIDFFGINKNGQETLLTGKVIGNRGAELAFDGNLLTYYTGKKIYKKKYIGIDLGAGNETQITKIRYTARGDDNAIKKGETYQLFYWKNKWVKLTTVRASTDNSIVFKDAPSGALFLVKDIKGGIENRIFSYEKGKQIFW